MTYETLLVTREGPICFVNFNRSETGNTINAIFLRELHQVVAECMSDTTALVLEGSPGVFCLGADFEEFDLWTRMATGPFITISRVRGRANAGGIGFVAASDLVFADESAQFCLPELL